ncbi:M28 family peptidase [Clostridium sp. AWRP]|uniref:M28 family peptidase n=1 Tax=Clostridium sp. AWRP TaxID=2212991 RepID=UPI000FDB1D44|nr:M28 family peptidase [Clostridium sp. AWRP]AZV55586.1 M28 family peptidase [Clostridium sp. AWRP]
MKKIYIISVFIFILISSCFFSGCNNLFSNNKKQSTITNNTLNQSNEKLMMSNIKALAISNRWVGSDNEKKACEYIKNKLQSYGYKTQIQTFPMPTDYAPNGKSKLNNSQNIIAINNSNSNHNKKVVIICAHYDCDKTSVGANDNASGVSVVMECARLLKNVSSDYELKFIFFSGEEIGGLGSRQYIKNLSSDDKKNIKAVINIDSIAQKDGGKPCIFTVNGNNNFATMLLRKVPKYMVVKKMSKELSDYTIFDEAGIPSLCIGQVYDKNLKINGPKDTISLIDESKLKLVADIIINSF